MLSRSSSSWVQQWAGRVMVMMMASMSHPSMVLEVDQWALPASIFLWRWGWCSLGCQDGIKGAKDVMNSVEECAEHLPVALGRALG